MLPLQPATLSRGSGTRLWPLSLEKYPKQLLTIDSALTMLQATTQRMAGFRGADSIEGAPVRAPIVVCNEEYRYATAEQLRSAGCNDARIVLEAVGRNTAPALTLAARLSAVDGADAILLVIDAGWRCFSKSGPSFSGRTVRN